MKTSGANVPMILVGGGSILVKDTLRGASELIRPEHFAVANAIGAAIAQVGGEIEQVFAYETTGRDEALARAKQEAAAMAVQAGAVPASIEIVEIEEIPLAYMPGETVRIRVKAVGDLDTPSATERDAALIAG